MNFKDKLKEVIKRITSHESQFGFIIATIIWLTIILVYHLFN
jgi:hypothetical protein